MFEYQGEVGIKVVYLQESIFSRSLFFWTTTSLQQQVLSCDLTDENYGFVFTSDDANLNIFKLNFLQPPLAQRKVSQTFHDSSVMK